MMGANDVSSRNVSIDALRTVSIFMVLFLHIPIQFLRFKLIPTDAGYYGVSLFFAISGYLITSGAMKRFGSLSTIQPWHFYQYRASRIFPGLVLLAALNIVLLFSGVSGFQLARSTPGALRELLFYVFTFQSNVYFYQGALPIAWGILWSLAIEEVFYILFPFVCFLFNSKTLLSTALACVVMLGLLVRSWAGSTAIYYYSGCFDQLAIGCLAAIALSVLQPDRITSIALKIAGTSLCAYIFFEVHVYNTTVLGPTGMAIGGALFIAGSMNDQSRSKIAHILTLPGQWSYEIYLFHISVMLILSDVGEVVFARNTIGDPYNVPIVIAIIIPICGIISVYALLPAQRWIRGDRTVSIFNQKTRSPPSQKAALDKSSR